MRRHHIPVLLMVLLALGIVISGRVADAPLPGQIPAQDRCEWVIRPPAARVIQNALLSAQPVFRLQGARISRNIVHVKLCGQQRCFQVVLAHPKTCANGERTGPWCIRKIDPPLTKHQHQALRRALTNAPEARVWSRVCAPVKPVGLHFQHVPAESTFSHWLQIVLILLFAGVAGWWMGCWLVRRELLSLSSEMTFWALLLGAPAVVMLVGRLWGLSTWSGLIPSTIAAAAFLRCVHQRAATMSVATYLPLVGSVLLSLSLCSWALEASAAKRTLSAIELGLMFGALGVLIVSTTLVLVKTKVTRTMLALSVALAAVFGLRWLYTLPAFAHANLHGVKLIEQSWAYPLQNLRNYGPFGVFVQGYVMRAFGADLVVLAIFNQLVAVLILAPFAILATRLVNSRAAGLLVLATAALHPILMRLGASEDAHGLGLLMAWMAFLTMERYATTKRLHLLAISAACTGLMLLTKQILYAVAPLVPLLGLARSRQMWRDKAFWVATFSIAALLLLRFANSASHPQAHFYITSLPWRMSSLLEPQFLLYVLSHHPLLDVHRFSLVLLPLLLVGAIWLVRQGSQGRFWVGALLWLFITSLWTYEGDKVAWMFRLPTLYVGLFVAGIGAWVCLSKLHQLVSQTQSLRRYALGVFALGALVLFVAPRAQHGWQTLEALGPLDQEYQYIKDQRHRLPQKFYLLVINERNPNYTFPMHLFTDVGMDAKFLSLREASKAEFDPGVPILFLRGVACYAYAFLDAFQTQSPKEAIRRGKRLGFTIGDVFDGKYKVPSRPRSACGLLLRDAIPISPIRHITTKHDDPPFSTYGVPTIPLQFFRVKFSSAPDVGPARK